MENTERIVRSEALVVARRALQSVARRALREADEKPWGIHDGELQGTVCATPVHYQLLGLKMF